MPDPDPYTCSASQIETAELCLRKWYLSKVQEIPREPNRFAQFGTLTHEHCADWFEHSKPPPGTPEGRAALGLIRHLPPPQTPGLETEKEILFSIGGVPFRGFVDLRNLSLETPWISDHKTTSDLKWAKSEQELREHPQPTAYAYEAMVATGKRAVDLQWTYTTRGKRPVVLPVRTRVTYEEIRPRLEKTAETANLLKLIWDERPDPDEIPYDPNGCHAFGGCPYQEICNLTPNEKFRGIMTQGKKNAFRERLQASKAKKGIPAESGTVNPPEAPPEAAAAPEPEKPKEKKPRKPRGKKAAKKAADVKAEAPKANGQDASTEPPAPTLPPQPQPQPQTALQRGFQQTVDFATQKYAQGFKDGFELGRQTR